MAESDRFTFYSSYAVAMDAMTDEQLAAYTRAMYRYAFDGEDTEFTDPILKMAWALTKPNIEASVRSANAGKASRKAPAKGSAKAPNETPSEGATKAPSEGATEGANEGSAKAPNGKNSNDRDKDRDKEEDRDREEESECFNAHARNDFPDPGFTPPTVEEAATYFAANNLRGDPERFVNVYTAQGWKRGNGRPVEDWRAQARLWSADQPKFDQIERDRQARSARAKGEAPPGPAWEAPKSDEQQLAELMAKRAARKGAACSPI